MRLTEYIQYSELPDKLGMPMAAIKKMIQKIAASNAIDPIIICKVLENLSGDFNCKQVFDAACLVFDISAEYEMDINTATTALIRAANPFKGSPGQISFFTGEQLELIHSHYLKTQKG